MKALAFVIAITIGFASLSFAQNCGITEAEARIENSYTWNILKARFELEGKPKHWQHKKVKYWINVLSNEAPVLPSELLNKQPIDGIAPHGKVKVISLSSFKTN